MLQNFNSQMVLLDRPGGGAGAGAGGMQEDDYSSYTPASDSGSFGRGPAKPVFDKKVDDEIPF